GSGHRRGSRRLPGPGTRPGCRAVWMRMRYAWVVTSSELKWGDLRAQDLHRLSRERPGSGLSRSAGPRKVQPLRGAELLPGAAREGGHPTSRAGGRGAVALCGFAMPVLTQGLKFEPQESQPIALLTQQPPTDGGIELDYIREWPEDTKECRIIERLPVGLRDLLQGHDAKRRRIDQGARRDWRFHHGRCRGSECRCARNWRFGRYASRLVALFIDRVHFLWTQASGFVLRERIDVRQG